MVTSSTRELTSVKLHVINTNIDSSLILYKQNHSLGKISVSLNGCDIFQFLHKNKNKNTPKFLLLIFIILYRLLHLPSINFLTSYSISHLINF